MRTILEERISFYEPHQAVSENLHILPPTMNKKEEFTASLDLKRWMLLFTFSSGFPPVGVLHTVIAPLSSKPPEKPG